jgi:HNH endonuclease
MHYNQVLVVDKSGNPRGWTGLEEDACKYYAEDMIICELGSPMYTFRGGMNCHGEQSKIVINSIIMVTGPVLDRDFDKRLTIYAEREIMYNRDCNMCAYCGIVYKDEKLSIDHVIPRAHGGRHTWTNTVTSCKPCNHAKADRTPEQAGMQLLYVPYAPMFQEKLLLEKRRVLADQMEYLKAKIPKTSRVWKNPLYN